MAVEVHGNPPGRNQASKQTVESLLLDALDCPVLLVDNAGDVKHANRAATTWLNGAASIAGLVADPHNPGASRYPLAAIAAAIADDAPTCVDVLLGSPSTRSAETGRMHILPFRSESGGSNAAVVRIEFHGDARNEGLSAERLELTRRLASLGKLATRVAHELNNPLDGILRYVNLSLRLAPVEHNAKLHDYLVESRTGLMRMTKIIADLLEFSRASDGQFDNATVNEIVEQAIKSKQGLAERHGAVIASDFQRHDIPAPAGNRLFQVCSNLIKNAIEAIVGGGRVTITTGLSGKHIVIRVSDTGPGLPTPPEKVFEAFYTTKDAGKGTGIGLAICRDFVHDMNGTITAASGEDGGAEFTIRLPLPNKSTESAGEKDT